MLFVMIMPLASCVKLRKLPEAEHLKERFDIFTDTCSFLPTVTEDKMIDSTLISVWILKAKTEIENN